MRRAVTAERVTSFMKALGASAKAPGRVFLAGGASAVLLGWRSSTIDVDLKIIPDSDEILRSLPALKERLEMNVELASPDDFIPALPGWQDRSRFIAEEGRLVFLHYDFYAQALAKIERNHAQDRNDVREMLERRLVEPTRLLDLFNQIEDQLYRYPALSPRSFRQAVEAVTGASPLPRSSDDV
jgi:hypothetical protein